MSAILYYIDMNHDELNTYNSQFPNTSDTFPESFIARLSPSRQAKIKSFRFEEDRLLSLGAGLLMDYGLRQYGLCERDVLIAYNENKKPCLPHHPQIHFNLSHSGTIALAAFGDQELGCDIEQIKTADYRIADRFFAAPEQASLQSLQDPAEKNTAFYRLWTLKESYLKALGTGTATPLNSFSLHLSPEPSPHTYATAEPTHQPLPYTFWEYPLPAYRAALCLKNHDLSLQSAPQRPPIKQVTLADIQSLPL